ncbi:hypothetical protein B0G52_11997 [Cohnella sp. SGD-V74]|uniref:hypothetical protein n=1 Tax=unclassified Cohnella TaxID=2636738 RepID=UPI000D4C67E9|nr:MULTISPECIES: hypothetical protein [unclassified Cohnella]PRX64558.1 hypothetical protein B0G52_11997 [Cohnella sp. SGD-V74]
MSIERLKSRFRDADPRYGPLPFWWWSAEEITEERIRWQLRKFRAGGLRNIGIINIAPTGPQYGSVGDNPVYFSERWWEMFEAALREAERLGMFLYFYDQIGFSGSNFPARLVAENSEFGGYLLRRFSPDERMPEGATPLLQTEDYHYVSVRQGFNWLDPAACAALLDKVHGEFERRFPHDLGRTIAGSFQDELPPLPLWTPQIAELYEARHGESLLPKLPALFDDLPESGQVRRQVYELAAELAERAFFVPIAQWHEKHGMLLCCDQAGSARKVDVHGAQRLYLDYLRTHRWYNAAGCDMDGEIKPHSSMVHLHGGKRVFLEAFHTSGWGGTLEETLHWLIPWFQAGVTLYSPHSVYYSTRGGWWEWAPPDTGWRQPYFEHYSVFADTISRVCALLSEGAHVAPVAVHYPSYAATGYMSLDDGASSDHPMLVANRVPNSEMEHLRRVYADVVGYNARRDQHKLGALREARFDFDVVDDSALEKSTAADGKLRIADETFEVLLLCGTTRMDEAARGKVERWIREGGWVIGIEVPEDDPAFEGVVRVGSAAEAVRLLKERILRVAEGPGMSLHRRTEEADIFLLLPGEGGLLEMHRPADERSALPESAVYRLRTPGRPQLWDPVSGDIVPAAYTRDGEWAELAVSFVSWPAALVVCPREEDGNGEPFVGVTAPAVLPSNAAAIPSRAESRELSSNDWRIMAVPTMDNRYGDFDLHGERTQEAPIERRQVRVMRETDESEGERAGWQLPDHDDASWNVRLWSEADYWEASPDERFEPGKCTPVVYSRTFGDHKFRSWAGRMGRVPRRFLNLGEIERGWDVWARTFVLAPAAGRYWIRVESNAEIAGWLGGEPIRWRGGPEEQTAWIDLAAGPNELKLRAKAIVTGLIRAGVEVNAEARPSLPKWIKTTTPNAGSRLTKTIEQEKGAGVERVRLVFAARGRAALYVNGTKVTEHGDFNPYIRQGQEEVDITSLWREGANEIRFQLPEGVGEVLADGVVELADGRNMEFWTEEDWTDENGQAAAILHEAVLQFAETETLWLSPRPHPLPDVGWLMPDSVPAAKPLPFQRNPAIIGRPVWVRFPLPVGATVMTVAAAGSLRVWIAGRERVVRDGQIVFPPQEAGTMAAIRIEPAGPCSDADVLLAPIRFRLSPTPGKLGDWRTSLALPHHSGAVEYERIVELRGDGRATLDLGHVRGTAEAWLDGRPLGVRAWRPYRFELGEALEEGVHRLRIRVTNTLGAHYEIGRPSHNVGGSTDPKVSYWNGSIDPGWQPQFAAGGLYGPVRIYEETS